MNKLDYPKLPDEALLRVVEICRPAGPVPMSRTRWYEAVASGEAPQPALRAPRCTVWRWSDVRAFLDTLAGGA